MPGETPYKHVVEVEFQGYWIRITVRNPDGYSDLFVGEADISAQGPESTDRSWARYSQMLNTCADPDTAFNKALANAKEYVARLASQGLMAAAIFGEHLADDGVGFSVRIVSGGRDWIYQGVATRSALMQIDASADLLTTFGANKSRFLVGLQRAWRRQPDTARFVVNSETASGGGDFLFSN